MCGPSADTAAWAARLMPVSVRGVVSMVPCDDGPANHGHARLKGRFGWTYNYAKDRITTPLLRDGTGWKPIDGTAPSISWLRLFSGSRIGPVPTRWRRYHPAAGRTRRTTCSEKFIRSVMGTNHIDNCARVCHSATVAGMMESFGASAATNSLEDLDRAKLIMVVGANPTESHPVIGAKMLRLARHGVPLIVIDPRRTEVALAAAIHLQLRPGTNVAL